MLEIYKDEQPILYNLLTNAIKNNKLSHAYLFETNDNPNSLDIIYSFIKDIIASQNTEVEKEKIFSRIDNGNYLELKVINPIGLIIKKEQISELQEEFSKVSIELNKKIYIINQCEKMNLQAANSLLKFLEEPSDSIIAILVTNNINKLPTTIVSRCQLISLNKTKIKTYETSLENILARLNNNYDEKNLYNEDIKKTFDDALEFISFILNQNRDLMIHEKKIWLDKFKEREDNLLTLDIIIYFYYDVLKYKLNKKNILFVTDIDKLEKASKCSVDEILDKLELFINVKKLMTNNLNLNLLIDYMLINYERRSKNDSWSQI